MIRSSLWVLSLVLLSPSVAGQVKSLADATSSDSNKSVYNFVEQMPEFPGGNDSLFRFMATHIHYPDSVRKAGIEGKVYLGFIVAEDGAVTNISIRRSSGNELLDQEAVRVMALSPKWKPGKQNGVAVRTWYMLPVVFRLEDDSDK